MNLYISRHGQSLANVSQTAVEDPHLTERGFAQAGALGERMAKIKLDLILSSPTRRALATANEVALRQTEGTKQVYWLTELTEVDWDLEKGQKLSPTEELLKACPGALPYPEPGPLGYTDSLPPDIHGGVDRAYAVSKFLTDRFLEKGINILVVAHGIFNSRFISASIGGEYPFFCRHMSDNAMLTLISYTEDRDGQTRSLMVFHNDIRHLVEAGLDEERA
ncbi:MAG TPA: histidine phosphatase family protein [Clostridiales bacterium]|jgi:broad specificity phosphatase PhoE|nr:histidine phosphatase family protein [Clostridiales bacterium]HRT82564.1 histidine phosphatase family protein [Oscillospiraceae bacterium]